MNIRSGAALKFEEVSKKLLLSTKFLERTLKRLRNRKKATIIIDKTNGKFTITEGADLLIDELEKKFVGRPKQKNK